MTKILLTNNVNLAYRCCNELRVQVDRADLRWCEVLPVSSSVGIAEER